MEILTHQEGNDLIKKKISENVPFAVSRVGSVELYVVEEFLRGRIPTQEQVMALSKQAGYYGNCLEEYSKEYLDGVSCADVQIFWKGITTAHDKGKNFDTLQEEIFEKHSRNSVKVGHRAVEPYFFQNPWTHELAGKRILVISPLSQTIRYQWKKIDSVWGERQIFPKIQLDVYQSVQSIGGSDPTNPGLSRSK